MVVKLLLLAALVVETLCALDESVVQAAKTAQKHNKYHKRIHDKFFADKEREPDVYKLQSGVLFQVLGKGPGGGRSPRRVDSCEVHYTATLLDGKVFDSTHERGAPSSLALTTVQVPGWVEALTLMCEGDMWRLYVPYWQSPYGEGGVPGLVPAFTPLVYDFELVRVQPSGWRGTLARLVGRWLPNATAPGGAIDAWAYRDAKDCARARKTFHRELQKHYDEL